ncbi:iron-containing redox enzyme family protein [Vibrio sp. 1F279]|uniref:iron-containing redox enzyme family protein n=2 Tax=Vibrio TaxID=662 RepID=UPI00352CDFEB
MEVTKSKCEVIEVIKSMIEESNINENQFYKTFREKELPLEKIKSIFQQYYFYIRTFPEILSGLAPRVDDELIRLKISRTVVSELGDGRGAPHFAMFEESLSAIGVTLDDYKSVDYTTETRQLINDLNRLFLEESPNKAIGAHYVIEEFGLPMIINLYEGFRLYDGWKHEDFNYFYLHILIESNHVDWIQDVLVEASKGGDGAREELISGASEVLQSLTNFWNGLHRLTK